MDNAFPSSREQQSKSNNNKNIKGLSDKLTKALEGSTAGTGDKVAQIAGVSVNINVEYSMLVLFIPELNTYIEKLKVDLK